MSGQSETKTVFRLLLAWNDQREERWLSQQQRAGWSLKKVRCFGYTFEAAAPGDVAYRLDLSPPRFHDRAEYFGLFRDAGWEHVGARGPWQIFRKDAVDGKAPEIHTDPQSRIAMYKRLLGLSVIMLSVMISQLAPRLASAEEGGSAVARFPVIFGLQLLVAAGFSYGIVRLLLAISRVKRNQAVAGQRGSTAEE
jgi:hypothetical protein